MLVTVFLSKPDSFMLVMQCGMHVVILVVQCEGVRLQAAMDKIVG
jgi:hypothetical protein